MSILSQRCRINFSILLCTHHCRGEHPLSSKTLLHRSKAAFAQEVPIGNMPAEHLLESRAIASIGGYETVRTRILRRGTHCGELCAITRELSTLGLEVSSWCVVVLLSSGSIAESCDDVAIENDSQIAFAAQYRCGEGSIQIAKEQA